LLADPLTAIYHTVQPNACKSAKLRLPELIIPARGAACRRRSGARGDPRLSWHWLFLIMRRKKTPHRGLRAICAGATRAKRTTGERCGGK
jgi:hypothetical protein